MGAECGMPAPISPLTCWEPRCSAIHRILRKYTQLRGWKWHERDMTGAVRCLYTCTQWYHGEHMHRICTSMRMWEFRPSVLCRWNRWNFSAEQPAILPTRRICVNPREPADINPRNADWQNFYYIGALVTNLICWIIEAVVPHPVCYIIWAVYPYWMCWIIDPADPHLMCAIIVSVYSHPMDGSIEPADPHLICGIKEPADPHLMCL